MKVVRSVLLHAKRLDHLTLYHDLFGRSEAPVSKTDATDISEWPLK